MQGLVHTWESGRGGGEGEADAEGGQKVPTLNFIYLLFFISFFSFCNLVISSLLSPLIILLYVFYFFSKNCQSLCRFISCSTAIIEQRFGRIRNFFAKSDPEKKICKFSATFSSKWFIRLWLHTYFLRKSLKVLKDFAAVPLCKIKIAYDFVGLM